MEPSADAVGLISDRHCHAGEKAAAITQKYHIGHSDVLEFFSKPAGFVFVFFSCEEDLKMFLKIC